jgi:hypothetical protein
MSRVNFSSLADGVESHARVVVLCGLNTYLIWRGSYATAASFGLVRIDQPLQSFQALICYKPRMRRLLRTQFR